MPEIEIFKAGTYRDMSGKEHSFTADDLDEVISCYSKANAAPLVLGHPKHDDPAHGWVTGLRRDQDILLAQVDKVSTAFAKGVKDEDYRYISAAFFPPNSTANPAMGKLYLRHVGALGATRPAIPGLKPLSEVAFATKDIGNISGQLAFASDDNSMIAFGEPLEKQEFGTFLRRLREFLVEKFGRQEADAAVPEWSIQDALAGEGSFANKPEASQMLMQTDKDIKMNEQEKKLAEREAALEKERLAFAAERARIAAEIDIAALEAKGQAFGDLRDGAISLLAELTGDNESLTFADGRSRLKADLLKALLDRPGPAPMGELSAPEKTFKSPAMAFAAPKDWEVKAEDVALLRKTEALAAERGCSVIEAAELLEAGR